MQTRRRRSCWHAVEVWTARGPYDVRFEIVRYEVEDPSGADLRARLRGEIEPAFLALVQQLRDVDLTSARKA